MATFRDHPYEGSNFLVDMGVFDPSDVRATFFRIELPDAIVDEVAYRSGADKTQEARKQPGLAKYSNLVLKHGRFGEFTACSNARASRTSTATSRSRCSTKSTRRCGRGVSATRFR